MRKSASTLARRWTVGTGVAVVLALVTVAFAAPPWTAESSGSAGAKSGHIDPVVASAATPSSELLPGESADAALTVTNPNKIAMVVTSIVGNGPITSSSSACDAAGHAVTFVDQTGSWAVAKNATLNVTLTNAVQMGLNSAQECQNVTFSIPVHVVAAVTDNGGGTPTTTTTTMPPSTTTTIGARASMTPSNYSFGNVPVGQTSTATFTLTNVGDSNGMLGNRYFFGAPDYQFEDRCGGAILAPGQSCTIIVSFTPSAPAFRSGSIEITMQPTNDRGMASFNGTGV